VPEFQILSYPKRVTLLEISGKIPPPSSILLDGVTVSETEKSFNNFLNMIEFLCRLSKTDLILVFGRALSCE
jgi:hypothetical protein